MKADKIMFVEKNCDIKIQTIYPRRKNQDKSCTAFHGEPLLCLCLRTRCNFSGYFSGLGNVASPQATSTDHGGPRTSDLSFERRRRNHFTTSPSNFLKACLQFFCKIFRITY